MAKKKKVDVEAKVDGTPVDAEVDQETEEPKKKMSLKKKVGIAVGSVLVIGLAVGKALLGGKGSDSEADSDDSDFSEDEYLDNLEAEADVTSEEM